MRTPSFPITAEEVEEDSDRVGMYSGCYNQQTAMVYMYLYCKIHGQHTYMHTTLHRRVGDDGAYRRVVRWRWRRSELGRD